MTFPNRTNYRLRSREKSRQVETRVLTANDTFATVYHLTEEKAQVQTSPHALLPLAHKLMAMISQPAKLLAALVVDCDEGTSKQEFWTKATTYQHSVLEGLCNSWCRIMEDIDQYELSPIDMMMLKATLYYWRLWQYVCSACVEAVVSIEESATNPKQESKPWTSLLQKRSAASISPPLEDKSSDALSQGMILSGGGLAKRSRISRKSNEFLIAWFVAHKDNPYPSPDERMEIAERTDLSEQQVRNWFANMRKRHWKPNRANAKKPRSLVDYMLRMTDS